MGFHKTPYGRLSPTQFCAHQSQKSSKIWKWLYFKKLIKITQPNLMILVSFSSAEDALSNDIKYNTFSSQGTENPPFRTIPLFWDTQYNNSLYTLTHMWTSFHVMCILALFPFTNFFWVVNIPYMIGVSRYMTNLSDKQVSTQKNGAKGECLSPHNTSCDCAWLLFNRPVH